VLKNYRRRVEMEYFIVEYTEVPAAILAAWLNLFVACL
jgi:hypothetical protein